MVHRNNTSSTLVLSRFSEHPHPYEYRAAAGFAITLAVGRSRVVIISPALNVSSSVILFHFLDFYKNDKNHKLDYENTLYKVL